MLRGRAGEEPSEAVDSAQIAEDIGMAALELAQRASAAGLITLCFLLEGVALEAGNAAASAKWPGEEPP